MKGTVPALMLLGLLGLKETPVESAPQLSVRERLAQAVTQSRELVGKSGQLDPRTLASMGLRTTFVEDQGALPNRFPKVADTRTYFKIRPWVKATDGPIY